MHLNVFATTMNTDKDGEFEHLVPITWGCFLFQIPIPHFPQ